MALPYNAAVSASSLWIPAYAEIARPGAAGPIYKAPPPVYNVPAGGDFALKSPPIAGKGGLRCYVVPQCRVQRR